LHKILKKTALCNISGHKYCHVRQIKLSEKCFITLLNANWATKSVAARKQTIFYITKLCILIYYYNIFTLVSQIGANFKQKNKNIFRDIDKKKTVCNTYTTKYQKMYLIYILIPLTLINLSLKKKKSKRIINYIIFYVYDKL
jgi:hypothetical protein